MSSGGSNSKAFHFALLTCHSAAWAPGRDNRHWGQGQCRETAVSGTPAPKLCDARWRGPWPAQVFISPPRAAGPCGPTALRFLMKWRTRAAYIPSVRMSRSAGGGEPQARGGQEEKWPVVRWRGLGSWWAGSKLLTCSADRDTGTQKAG